MIHGTGNDCLRAELSRRRFLRGALTVAGATMAAGLPLSSAAAGATRGKLSPGTAAVGGTSLPAGRELVDVVAHRGRLVAVGLGDDGRTGVWFGDIEGQRWAAVDVPAELTAASVSALSELRGSLLAVGSLGDEHTYPACWRSEDGVSWRRSKIGHDGRFRRLTAVAVGPDQALAVGCVLDDEASEGVAPLILGSVDGANWTARDHAGLPELAEGELTSLAYHSDRWLAVGLSVAGSTLWTSRDGSGWTKQSGPPFDTPGVAVTRLASNGSEIVAAGSDLIDLRPRMWSSVDAASWHEMPLPLPLREGRDPVVIHSLGTLPQRPGRLLVAGQRDGQAMFVDMRQE